MEKFTKGKWVNNGRLVYNADAVFIATASKTDIEDFSEVESNASLIAAAPEMYEMLKAQCRMMHKIGFTDERDAIQQLLAKARGEK